MIIKYIQPIVLQRYYKSGSSYTSVFTVVIPGVTVSLTAVTPPTYYGRVRSFDNSGNKGSWTSLIGSVATLIDSVEITELTASKIKAGTITSSVIALDGVSSVIKSSGYSAGSTGWAIKGDGTAEFGSASIRGGLKAESVFINADNRWRRNSGDTAANNEFKVGSATDYLYYNGTNTLTFTGRLESGDIYIPGTSNAKFYVDSNGNMTCVDAQINGTLNGAGGTFQGRLQAGDIYIPNTSSPKFFVDGNGNMTCFDAQIDGNLNGATGTFRGRLEAGDIYIPNTTSPKFFVDGDGNMTCFDAHINGTITSGSGNVGGWAVNPTSLSAGSTTLYNNGAVTIGEFELDTFGNLDAGQGEFDATIQSQGTLRVVRSGWWSASGGGGRGISLVGFRNKDNETVVGTIQFTSTFANISYNTSSDIRLKTIVDKPMNALEKILQITPRNYYWNEEADPITWERLAPDKKTIDYGFIAQELYEVFPQMVAVGGDDPKTEPWQIDYSRITPLLVKAIQELSAKVANLESKMV